MLEELINKKILTECCGFGLMELRVCSVVDKTLKCLDNDNVEVYIPLNKLGAFKIIGDRAKSRLYLHMCKNDSCKGRRLLLPAAESSEKYFDCVGLKKYNCDYGVVSALDKIPENVLDVLLFGMESGVKLIDLEVDGGK